MGGANPYIDDADFELPKAKYPIVFRISETGEELEFEVDPEALPYDHDGLPGSILDIAQGHGVDLQHTCGGVCACSTCHVKVLEGLDTCNESSEAEEDQLDMAPDLHPTKSRLGCQCVPNGQSRVVVEIPAWNRNQEKEAPH